MKTLIVYELVPEETKFFIVEGDRSDLNGCFVNSKRAEEFSPAIREEVGRGDQWGAAVETPITSSGEIQRIVHCGFFL